MKTAKVFPLKCFAIIEVHIFIICVILYIFSLSHHVFSKIKILHLEKSAILTYVHSLNIIVLFLIWYNVSYSGKIRHVIESKCSKVS